MHVTEEGLVVLHDLLVDREGVGEERLVPSLVRFVNTTGLCLTSQSAVIWIVASMDMCPLCWSY